MLKTPVLVALLLFTLLAGIASTTRPAQSIPGPSGGAPTPGVDDPANIWAPYGPRSARIQLNYYASEVSEFTDFQLGHLDLTDWPVSSALYGSFDANPDLVLSVGQGEFGMFGIDFNHNATTWASWGCNFQHGNSACGIEIRQAFAHLIDRSSFVNQGPLQGAGQAIADPTPPAKSPAGSSLPVQNAWDTLSGQTIAGLIQPSTISAFHIAPSPGGFAAQGSSDFCAARNHLINANIGLKDDNLDCVIDPSSPGLPNLSSHPIRFMVRSDDANRRNLGEGLANAINQVLGTNVVNLVEGSIAALGSIVFVSAPDGATDDWDMYTFGWSLGGPFPDHILPLYGNDAASDQCGGTLNGEPLNYGFVCISSFNQLANAAAQTSDINVFISDTTGALDQFGRHAANIPVYSRGIRTAGLRDIAGLVNLRGGGYTNSWTLLDGRDDTSYTPSNPIFAFGGGSNTLRWGQRQGTTHFNPFLASTVWEFNVISEVYDTLLATSPVQPSKVICWMCNSYTQSVDSTGNTHIVFQLRQGLRWQDGPVVDAKDAKFTLLNYRDVPAAVLSGNVEMLLGVNVLSSTVFEVIMRGQSISHLINLAGVPILPRHLWELAGDTTYGDVGRADPAKTSTGYDVLVAGNLIGSGPYVCRSIFPSDLGAVGTGCARSAEGTRAGEALAPGASMLLVSFDRTSELADPFAQYMRSFNTACPSSPPYNASGNGPCSTQPGGQFQEWSWADQNNDGVVDVLDLGSVSTCLNGSGAACPVATFNYWHRLSSGTLLTLEAARVASHLDDTWVGPFSWSGSVLENITPFTP